LTLWTSEKKVQTILISKNKKGQFTGESSFEEMECQECGTPFTPKSYSAKYCDKDCMYKARSKRRKANVNYKKSIQNNNYKRKYGITLSDYNKLLKQQNNRCNICSIHESELNTRLCVDHSHVTGTIRGLLCHNCNRGIGLLQDDYLLLEVAARYLKEYSDE